MVGVSSDVSRTAGEELVRIPLAPLAQSASGGRPRARYSSLCGVFGGCCFGSCVESIGRMRNKRPGGSSTVVGFVITTRRPSNFSFELTDTGACRHPAPT
jgi:hypothetical protein